MFCKPLSSLTVANNAPPNRLVLLVHHLSLYHGPPVSSSLKFCNRSLVFAAPALWNGLQKALSQFVNLLTQHLISPRINQIQHKTHSANKLHCTIKTSLGEHENLQARLYVNDFGQLQTLMSTEWSSKKHESMRQTRNA